MSRTLRLISLLAVLAAPAVLGCASDKKAAQVPQTPAPAANGQASVGTARNGATPAAGPGVESPALRVSDEIARMCSLPRAQFAASFDFDSTAIGPQDKDLLQAIAKCLSDGPLRGRRVALIGRADPRGEAEYNMSLGGTRSDSVRRFLREMGVEDTRVGATSRGELDAVGTDEDSWARDRRVDIELAN